MTRSLKRAVLISFLLGIIVPCAIELGGHALDAMDAHPGMWLSNVVIWLWPTGIVLMETSDDLKSYLFFAITAILNGMLYAFITLVGGYLIGIFRRDKSEMEGWWPS